jgi:membrane-associated phospholipid phosphatase
MRGYGVVDALSTLPDAVVAGFAAVTQLGDAWFLFVLLAGVYWFADERVATDPRRVGALVVAFTVGALALTLALKTSFALPRPPGAGTAAIPGWLPTPLRAAFVDAATGDGFGFPSGHAIGTTVAYGGVALLGTWASRRRRWVVAGAVVGLVAVSRVALGVHYLADVVVGVAVGLAFLGLAVVVASERPTRAFGLAVVVATLAVAVAVVTTAPPAALTETVAVLGASVGGLVGWQVVQREPPGPQAGEAALGLAVAGGLWFGSATGVLGHPTTFLAAAGAVAIVLTLPALSLRLRA